MIAAPVPLMLEAAMRALLSAIAVWVGLRLLGVRNVLVQKSAWGLVLIAALAMPLVPHWQGPPALAALHLPALPLSATDQSLPVQPQKSAAAVAAPRVSSALPARDPASIARGTQALPRKGPTPSQSMAPESFPAGANRSQAPEISISKSDLPAYSAPTPATYASQPVPAPSPAALHANRTAMRVAAAAGLLYLCVFSALLLRLLFGLASALELWMSANPVCTLDESGKANRMAVRSSTRVASPVNIGSGIVLPADYVAWEGERLRVVLAHERSHVRQGDFYLQMLAGFYAAIFWFSPLGWWLKRKLSELSEAISDRAGLEEAASRSSYAQLLLEFAALPRPTLTGVAMARSSHLAQRIERLLNESSFRQSFAAGGRRALLAAFLVPAALVAATALVRVEAAAAPTPQAQPAPQAQDSPSSQPAMTGQSTSEQVAQPAPAAVPAPDGSPVPPPTLQSAPSPFPAATPGPPQPPPAGDAGPGPGPMAPMPPNPFIVDMPPMPPMPEIHLRIPRDAIHVNIDPNMSAVIAAEIAEARADAEQYRGSDIFYSEPYAIVGDPGSKPNFIGHRDDNHDEDIEKARKVAHGHFLWFRHEGKSYIVDDPATVTELEAMNKPMDDLRGQMHSLGEQMRALGEEQKDLGKQMRDISVPTPDLSKEMAELSAAVATLQAKQGGTISQKDLGDLQREVGRIQGELGALQGKIGAQQGALGGNMGKFGGQMGELGGQMGKLGAEIGELSRENQSKVKKVVDESLKDGKAKPVE